MRPVVAIAGAAILVLLALLTYFVPTGFSQSGPVYIGSGPLHTDGAGAAVVNVPSSMTFLPNLPVNITLTNVPAGALIEVFPCPQGVTNASECAVASPQFVYTYNVSSTGGASQTVYIHLNVNVGHAFVISTTAARGAQTTYSATVPFWATSTWLVVVFLVVGVVLVGIGLAKPAPPPARRDDEGAYGPQGPLRRFCETCGSRYSDDTTMYCPSCGAPRT